MKTEITARVQSLRNFMRTHGLDAFVLPSTDPHAGEYIPAHWQSRQWISGFDGSAGTAVVTLTDAALWTDSRYFLAAAEQLDGTPFCLMKDKLPETPSVAEWLGKVLPQGACVGVDGWVNTAAAVETLRNDLAEGGFTLRLAPDPMAEIWTDRPPVPDNPAVIQPLEFAGVPCREKVAQIRAKLTAAHADGLVVSALDEVAWTLNLRGTDVHCNPVFVSYLLILPNSATLYINKVKISDDVQRYLFAEGIDIRPYEAIEEDVRKCAVGRLLIDPDWTNSTLFFAVPETCKIVRKPSPVAMLKAVKNEAEIRGYRNAMLRDGVALVKFLRWLKPAVEAGGQTECSIAQKLENLRAEQPLFKGISFDTIAGYAAHGAIVHYEPTPETDIPLAAKGLLLLDSGAQYQDGTTDITRTIALGSLTDEERRDYTLVLKGHICLSRARFPEGSSGTQLDICARYAMWQEGINYLHGTGHGVGAYLNVHEGPHQFRMNYMPAPLLPHLTITNEPGIYKAGKHGCRTENVMLIVPFKMGEFGQFLQFEPLTLCPIDTTPIVWNMMARDEVEWLNAYHQTVYEKLSPLLDGEDLAWLRKATQPVASAM